MRDGVWAARVTKGVVEVRTASEGGKEGQVEATDVAEASVSVTEEGETLSDVNNVTALVKELKGAA